MDTLRRIFMSTQEKKPVVIATAAQGILTSTDCKKFIEDEPNASVPVCAPSLEHGFAVEKTDLGKSDLKKHVSSVNDKHAWAIFLDEKLITKRRDGNLVENYLIGYENGLKARKNETHFSQKENDPVSHRIIFQPEPHYISYSFFYGFFAQTIRLLCLKTVYGDDYAKHKDQSMEKIQIGISAKKEILDKFNKKYTFAFPKNRALEKTMEEYAGTLIENVIEVRENLGNKIHSKTRRLKK